MRAGNFSAGLAKLRGAVDALRLTWNDAAEKWDDETSRALKEQHLDPLLLELCEVAEATVPLQDVVNQALRECEP
jgi:hypothetical protein